MKNKLWDRMLARKGLVFYSRMLMFTFTVFWTMGLILVSLLLYHYLLIPIVQVANPNGGLLTGFILAWYVITFILLAWYAALRGFRFIGKWERREDKDQ